jgi:predicted DNA-binding transcriptional regulator YafY
MKHYDQDYYLRSHLQNDDIDKRMMEQLAEAKRDCLWVKLQYKGTKDDDFQTIFIHPYELVHRHNSTYVVAYSLKVKDYRNFRVQATRMRNVEVLDKHFQRDSNFQLQDHIGTANLMRNEKIRLHLKIYGQSRRYIKESMIGQNRQIIAGENYDEVYLDLEGKESVISFLLTLRDEVEIISPPDIKTKMQEIIVNMQTKYNSY